MREVARFMRDYAQALSRGDRAAIAGRYDRGGALLIRNGVRLRLSWSSIAARYADPAWQAPHALAWERLVYTPRAGGLMEVRGRFRHVDPGGSAHQTTYNALLSKAAGSWRIIMEAEARIR